MMRARNVVLAALRLRELSIAEFARRNGMSPPSVRQKLSGGGTLPATKMFEILGLLNIDCRFSYRGETDKDGDIYLPAGEVSPRQVFREILDHKGISSYEVSRILKRNEQSMAQKILQRETIRANEFFDVLDALDVDCAFYDGETKNRLVATNSFTEPISGVSAGKWYRTTKSTLIASSFGYGADGGYGPDKKAVDLYIDPDGDYFVVEYTKGGEPRVRAVPVHVAQAILDKYKVEICSEPV